MNRPVNLQNHIQFGTIKISNKTVNYLLPPPFQISKLPIAQHLPHRIFTFSRILAKMSGKFKFFGIYFLTCHTIVLGRLLPLSAMMERGPGGEGVRHIITLFLLRQKPLHLNPRHSTSSSGYNSLTIRAVLAVAASENALHVGGS